MPTIASWARTSATFTPCSDRPVAKSTGGCAATVDLDLFEVCLLLAELRLAHLRVADGTDNLATFFRAVDLRSDRNALPVGGFPAPWYFVEAFFVDVCQLARRLTCGSNDLRNVITRFLAPMIAPLSMASRMPDGT